MKDLLRHLIQVHSKQCSLDDQELKNSINSLIFKLFNFCYFGSEDFESKIITEKYVYCYTKESIKKLLKRAASGEDVILCTSEGPEDYSAVSFNKPYTHKYKLFIKPNCYGIRLNTFGVHAHPNEHECLVKLSSFDLDNYEELKVK